MSFHHEIFWLIVAWIVFLLFMARDEFRRMWRESRAEKRAKRSRR